MRSGAENLDISKPIADFRTQCQEWANYDQNLHSIRVKHVRKYVVLVSCFASE